MWRIVDIGGEGHFIHVDHNNMIATKDQKEVLRIHFSDILSIVCHSYGCSYSDVFLKKCLEYKIPFIICDNSHTPQGMFLPLMQHTNAGVRLETQVLLTIPQKKKAWKEIISQKLKNQALLIEKIGHTPLSTKLKTLSEHVLSGDTDNKEAQGARLYFRGIFGQDFLRHSPNPINDLLNYGYIILRSCVARAVIGAGLHPSFGMHHSNKSNPYCLVDDLIEPFRPIVDALVIRIIQEHEDFDLSPIIKKRFIALSKYEVYYKNECVELSTGLQYFTQDFYRYLNKEKVDLIFPEFSYDFGI